MNPPQNLPMPPSMELPIEQKVLDALRNPRERSVVLDFERQMLDFISSRYISLK
jgi:hypothetical protein